MARKVTIAIMALVAVLALTTSTASAAAKKGPNGCSYTHKPSSNQCEGQVGHKSHVDTSFTNPFLSLALPNVSVAGAESLAQANVTILSFVKAKGLTKKQKSKMKCVYVPAGTGYWNSAKQADGSLRWFWDTRAGTICTDKHGNQYRAECGNQVRKKMPPKVVQGEIRLVRTFGSFKVSVTVSEKVGVYGVCGYAEASASASASARGYTKVQARGNAQILASGNAKAEAYARAVVALHCAPITPPPTCEQTGTCPPPPCTENCTTSVLILSMTDLNDIPTGKSSGPYYVEVSASAAGGTLTVDPGIGSITDCNGSPREGSMTLPVPKGVTKFCFVIWAPNDPAKPTEMKVTATAVLGNSSAYKEDKLGITYPVRPE